MLIWLMNFSNAPLVIDKANNKNIDIDENRYIRVASYYCNIQQCTG